MTTTTRRIGQQSTWTATFRTDAGQLINPDTVEFHWKLKATPGIGQVFTFGVDSEVTSPSVGVFRFLAPAYTEAATYAVRVVSTGPATANEQTVPVETSMFTPVP